MKPVKASFRVRPTSELRRNQELRNSFSLSTIRLSLDQVSSVTTSSWEAGTVKEGWSPVTETSGGICWRRGRKV